MNGNFASPKAQRRNEYAKKLKAAPSGAFLLLIIPCLGLLAVFAIFSRNENRVELFYARTFFPHLQRVVQAVAGIFPFSLAEVLIGTALLSAILACLGLVLTLFRGMKPGRLAFGAATVFVSFLIPVAVWGYLFWGLNYSRPPAPQRLGWTSLAKDTNLERDRRELILLAEESVQLANRSYRKATGTFDTGAASAPRAGLQDLDKKLEAGFRLAAQALNLDPAIAMNASPAKSIFSSKLLSHLGIAGFYFPWTGEANFNRLQPACDRYHSIAHEKAHQRGVAREDEAGFFGFLACQFSDDPYLQYSGFLFASRQLLEQLSFLDREEARRIHSWKIAGVHRDERAVLDFWKEYQGWGTTVGDSVNDAFLRIHGVEQGIESYSESARLLVLLARRNGGRLGERGRKAEVRGDR